MCFFAGGFWKSVGNMGALGHFLGRFQFSEVLQVFLLGVRNNRQQQGITYRIIQCLFALKMA